MSSLKFPSFNFPYTSSEDLRQFLVDYGRTGAVHVFKNGQNIECIAQRKEINENIKDRFISEKPTLPLNHPAEISGKLNNGFNNMEPQTPLELLDCKQPVTNFTSDYGNVVFGELAKAVGTEAAALSWHPPPCEPSKLWHLTQFDPVLKTLENDFSDIPQSLLTDLVKESSEEEKVMANGKYYNNCLAFARSTSTKGSDIVLVYPGGTTMSNLCFNNLEIDHKERDSSVRLSARTGSFSLPERICEISMGNEFDQDTVIAVRTDKKCWFFGSASTEGFEKPTFLGNLQCKTKPCAVTVSPYIPEEVIVAMETGSLWLWNAEDSSVQIIRQCSSCTPDEFDWYFSKFGSHPREVVRGNQTNVELIDLRVGSSTSQDLITLPSSHFFPGDKFTTIQHYQDNPYHYILATTQSLVIMDTRFQQHPVLKWCHSLEYPVKYINVLPDPTSSDVLVFVGSYENHDIHCFQYCYGENWSSPLGMADELTSILPPRSTSNPWKISSYSEWPQMVDYPNKAQSYPKVIERLRQPLLGLSCIPNSTSLVVVQLSNAGDLFYQNLFQREFKLKEVRGKGNVEYYEDLDLNLTASGGCGSKKINLGETDIDFITKWVECLMEHVDMSGDLDENCDVEDVEIIREELFSCLSEIDVQCSLCNDRDECSSGAPEICPYCKMPQELSNQLDKVRKAESQRKVLTKKCLGLSYEPGTLQMFNEGIECNEPLGNVLLRNWYSEEQIPIDLTGKQNIEEPEGEGDKQDAVKIWLEQGQGENLQIEGDQSPLRNTGSMESPVTKTVANIKSPAGDGKNIGSPSQEAQVVSRQGISVKNLHTPDHAPSGKTSEKRTPNLVDSKSPRNPMSSPLLARAGGQTRTPTKKKISRIPGF